MLEYSGLTQADQKIYISNERQLIKHLELDAYAQIIAAVYDGERIEEVETELYTRL